MNTRIQKWIAPFLMPALVGANALASDAPMIETQPRDPNAPIVRIHQDGNQVTIEGKNLSADTVIFPVTTRTELNGEILAEPIEPTHRTWETAFQGSNVALGFILVVPQFTVSYVVGRKSCVENLESHPSTARCRVRGAIIQATGVTGDTVGASLGYVDFEVAESAIAEGYVSFKDKELGPRGMTFMISSLTSITSILPGQRERIVNWGPEVTWLHGDKSISLSLLTDAGFSNKISGGAFFGLPFFPVIEFKLGF